MPLIKHTYGQVFITIFMTLVSISNSNIKAYYYMAEFKSVLKLALKFFNLEIKEKIEFSRAMFSQNSIEILLNFIEYMIQLMKMKKISKKL